MLSNLVLCEQVEIKLTDALDGGSKKTAEFADKRGRPCLHFRPGVHPKFLAQFLARHRVTTLNVAGKRESAAPGIHRFVCQSLDQALASLSAA